MNIKDDIKNLDKLKDEEDLTNEDDLKNEGSLKNEDDMEKEDLKNKGWVKLPFKRFSQTAIKFTALLYYSVYSFRTSYHL